jgi:hypothetical protein
MTLGNQTGIGPQVLKVLPGSFFGEDLIQAIIACASQLPAETEPNDRRSKLINILVDYNWRLGFDGWPGLVGSVTIIPSIWAGSGHTCKKPRSIAAYW